MKERIGCEKEKDMYQRGIFRLEPMPAVVAPAVINREDVNALLPRRDHYTASRWEKLGTRARRIIYVRVAEKWRTRREAERHDWNRLVDAQIDTTNGATMPTVTEADEDDDTTHSLECQ